MSTNEVRNGGIGESGEHKIIFTATPPQYPRYDGWIEFSMTLKATHRGKGKLFLDGWKEEDLYHDLP